MFSDASSRPTSLTQFRPAIYILTGVVAAYAIFYAHSRYVSSQTPPPLHRRNAVRRRGTRRRGGISLPSGESRVSNDFSGPIQALDLLERSGQAYGTFRMQVDGGRSVECRLIPSQLPSVEQIQEELESTREHAQYIRSVIENALLDNFLAMEFRSSHTILFETGEWQYLSTELLDRGLSGENITAALTRFNESDQFGEELRRRRLNGESIRLTGPGTSVLDPPVPSQTVQTSDQAATTVDDQSIFSWRDGNDDGTPTREGQNLLNLLYHIAEDQARRDGYIHRGVTCNSCGAMPIQGIRYRCANCIDYDLCETCEAMQVHIKTHLFYKVRIPAPFLGNPRQPQPVWYPGKPAMLPRSLPRNLAKRLMKETNFENTELDALWDQFRCLANVEWVNDPNKLNMAIDRKTFDRCFVPNTSIRPPPPSLIYDRMFSFYDTNGDNLIGFEEFLKGLASFSNKSVHERLRRIFEGYDIDRDGYVERKDFLRIFRAYYTLSRELTRDMVAGMEDDFLEGGTRDIILGSQPISSAFPGNIPPGEPSRIGEGKRTNLQGDMEIIDNAGVLREDGDDTGDRNAIIADAAVRERFGRTRPLFTSRLRLPDPPFTRPRRRNRHARGDNNEEEYGDEEDNGGNDSDSYLGSYSEWPNEQVRSEDVVNALGSYIPLEEITDPVDRARIAACAMQRIDEADRERMQRIRREGIDERWARRAFYTDEEDGAIAPAGYRDAEDFHDGVEDIPQRVQEESHPPTPRSRSSSKVRFQDDITDNEYETRSNLSTSSRSVPVAERWGGFEVPEAEKDVGKEVLYQVTQQGLNELLDLIFKPKENLLMEARRTKVERQRWAKEINNFTASLPKNHYLRQGIDTDKQTEEPGQGETEGNVNSTERPREEPLGQLLDDVDHPSSRGGGIPGHSLSSPGEEDITGQPARVSERYNMLDPTLPQNRPNDSDLEPFPPVPEGLGYTEYGEEEEYEVAESGPTPPDPTLPQNRPDRAASGRSLHITEVSSSTTLPYEHSVFEQSPVYESASTSTSVSAQQRPQQQQQSLSRPRSTPSRNQSLPLRLRFHQSASSSPRRQQLTSTAGDVDRSHSSVSLFSPPSPSSSSSLDETNTQPNPPSPPLPPSPKTLARWSRLNQVEREAKARGGSGAKLNFDEFVMRMQGERGRRLGFVASWIDMTSF
ncbi:EF hand domain-containing protein [Histoplasma capsulatum G186AR]|uniref:EF hand domain-containing protein n=2 Tax=Ajellomyces capsulatus TaxID=5037 RepID=C0NXM9_AJECG|nr:EF hand domain-containing protein [Histoplasma capsulatum G186AR]EEH04095.1 EF hand domain-containing protein [Histoplasma capsulatum G186AR]KAG5295694.1 EF hand domain-containing protein [Histoplasma capsulatum]QSS73675.1 EF hand domain-containing protein [Histoplasma capsulatum G186AR]